MALERLKKSGKQGMKKLTRAAEREKIFLQNLPFGTDLHMDFTNHDQDPVANFIALNYHSTDMAALATSGNGDCLFNAFSIYLCGNESRSVELRYRCCVEMIVNRSKMMRHRLYTHLEILSPDYDQDCMNCTQIGSFSSAWMLIALSNLLNIAVNSVYPLINGSRHLAYRTLNNFFRPPFADPQHGTITIMWTNTKAPEKNVFSRSKRGEQTEHAHLIQNEG